MNKELNQQVGALKRKFKLGKGDFEPGTLIDKAKAQKPTMAKELPKNPKNRTAIMGLV